MTRERQKVVDKNKNSKLYDLNEYGELTIRTKERRASKQLSWQARFLKAMIALLLITVILLTIMK